MKTFSKLTLASVSVLALLTLAACGNPKDKTDSSSSAPSSSKVTKESSSTDSNASVKVNKDGSTEVSDGNDNSAKTNGNNTVEANDSEGNSETVGQDGSVEVNSQDGTNVKVGSDERPRHIKKRVAEVLELVGLKHKMRSFPNQLSGGEQQRVAIARAIVNNPKVLIADEPTGNLDPEISWEIMQVLERINLQGTTILMATHNSTIVNNLRHRVIAIEEGRIVRDEEEGEYGYHD